MQSPPTCHENDVTRWLHSHSAKSDNVLIYLSNMQELFYQPTQPEYGELLEHKTQKWNTPFHDYYTNVIAPDITS